MNKTEFIAAVALEAGITKTEGAKVVGAMTKIITQALRTKEAVSLPGFGSFSIKDRPARKGHNPATGKVIDIPAKSVVRFLASASMLSEEKR